VLAFILKIIGVAATQARKFQNMNLCIFMSQNRPRRTYILWKPLFIEKPSGIGSERVVCGQGGI
jgi:hypothetical protein